MKRKVVFTFIIFSILLLLLSLNIKKTTIEKFQNNRGFDIIIVAGQSNSVGRGLEEHKFPKTRDGMNHKTWRQTLNMYKDDYHGDNGRRNNLISSFNKDNRVRNETLDPIEHQETYPNRQDPRRRTFGFAVSFAREYVRQGMLASGRRILIVGCGHGGTGFRNNGPWMAPNGSLYQGTISRGRAAMSNTDQGPTNRLIAILWHQGENDVSQPQNYMQNLSNCLNGIRNALQPTNPESVPILLGGLVPGLTTHKKFTEENIEPVTRINTNINFRFVPSVAMPSVRYASLTLFNHDLLADKDTGNNHFSKTSMIEFGKRYFYIFNNSRFNIET